MADLTRLKESSATETEVVVTLSVSLRPRVEFPDKVGKYVVCTGVPVASNSRDLLGSLPRRPSEVCVGKCIDYSASTPVVGRKGSDSVNRDSLRV